MDASILVFSVHSLSHIPTFFQKHQELNFLGRGVGIPLAEPSPGCGVDDQGQLESIPSQDTVVYLDLIWSKSTCMYPLESYLLNYHYLQDWLRESVYEVYFSRHLNTLRKCTSYV